MKGPATDSNFAHPPTRPHSSRAAHSDRIAFHPPASGLRRPWRRRIFAAAARTVCCVPSRVRPPSSALIASTSGFEVRVRSYAESFAWRSPWWPCTASMN